MIKKIIITLCVLGAALFVAGPAKAAAYDYQITFQSAPTTVAHGTHKTVKLDIKNVGTSTWNFTGANALHLGTSHPQDRGSGFTDGWLASNRIALTRNLTNPANTTTIPPNEIGEFEFSITTSGDSSDDMGGTYNEYFQPVVENITWLPDKGLYFPWTVPAKVGVFWYGWYGPGETRWGGTVDNPNFGSIVGHYDSADTNVQRQQLQQMTDAGVGFVVLDWWETLPPPGDTQHSHDAAIGMINLIHSEFPNMKYTFLVEPPLGNQITPIPQGFLNTIYATYGTDPQYLKYHSKPLMTCYLFRTCAGQDGRFSYLQFSGATGYSYPTLLLWHYPIEDIQGDVTSLLPRFDNRGIGGGLVYDWSYGENLQGSQLTYVGGRKNIIRLMFMNSWNEQYERTQIEPHHNPDTAVSDTYAKDKLKTFVTNVWNQP